jgi:hypothetical protein
VYTLGAAAKATGMTKSAIFKAIKKGRISAKKNEMGRYDIDPAELHRVYPSLPAPEKDERERTQETATENRELKVRLALLEELIREIREDRDHWRRQASALTHQPEREAPKTTPPRSSWFWWLPW